MTSTEGDTFFGAVAMATCDTGFSFDQSPAIASKQERIFCQADGKYAKVGECKRIFWANYKDSTKVETSSCSFQDSRGATDTIS